MINKIRFNNDLEQVSENADRLLLNYMQSSILSLVAKGRMANSINNLIKSFGHEPVNKALSDDLEEDYTAEDVDIDLLARLSNRIVISADGDNDVVDILSSEYGIDKKHITKHNNAFGYADVNAVNNPMYKFRGYYSSMYDFDKIVSKWEGIE